MKLSAGLALKYYLNNLVISEKLPIFAVEITKVIHPISIVRKMKIHIALVLSVLQR